MVLDLIKREKILCCVSIFRRVCYVDGYEFRWQVYNWHYHSADRRVGIIHIRRGSVVDNVG